MKHILLMGLLVTPLVGVTASPKENRPNVVYIMADDLGIGDLGCYGQQQIKTPAIDGMAANGMRFLQHYSGSTVSAPSRCSLMTGKHTGHTCIRGNSPVQGPDGLRYDFPLAAGEVTVADIMKRKNYRTACIGKWGMGGPDSEGRPDQHGFDYFFGYSGQGQAHFYYPEFLFENNEKVELDKKSYSYDLMMEKTLDFIDKNADAPFFLYFSPTIPHAELIVPDGELGDYDGKYKETPFKGGHYCAQPKPRATYAAMVSRLDRGVQQIIDQLKKKGIYGNTIIIFTSDNGVHHEGGHDPDYFDSNGPYRGYKRDLYEGGVRTPFVVQWPKGIAPGTVCSHVSAFWDFLPTLCNLIGEKVPENIDGISYLPSLTGKGKQVKHKSIYFEFHEEGGKQAIIKENWKLIRLLVNNPEKMHYELYNLTDDPGEKNDLSAVYPAKVKKLIPLMDCNHTYNPNFKFINEQ